MVSFARFYMWVIWAWQGSAKRRSVALPFSAQKRARKCGAWCQGSSLACGGCPDFGLWQAARRNEYRKQREKDPKFAPVSSHTILIGLRFEPCLPWYFETTHFFLQKFLKWNSRFQVVELKFVFASATLPSLGPPSFHWAMKLSATRLPRLASLRLAYVGYIVWKYECWLDWDSNVLFSNGSAGAWMRASKAWVTRQQHTMG